MKRPKCKAIYYTGICLFLFIGILLHHFRFDLFPISEEYYVLENWSEVYRKNPEYKYKGQIILLAEAPYLSGNRTKHIETIVWKKMPLDTLNQYNTIRIYFYRQTEDLTREFKEGKTSSSYYGRRDDFMSWRNHHEERVAQMSIIQGGGNTIHYYLYIYDSGYGLNCFIDISKLETSENTFNSVEDLYFTKRKELGIVTNEKD